MPGTPGENATPSEHEGAADASPPKHGEGASGDVTSEGTTPAEAGGAQTDLPGEGQTMSTTGSDTEPRAAGDEGSGASDASAASTAGGEGSGSSDASEASTAGGEGSASASGPESSEARDAGTGTSSEPSAGEGDGSSTGADARNAGETGQGEGTDAGADASTGPGRYVELASGERVQDASGTGSDGGGEAKDVLEEPRTGPVSGADDALLGAGIWDVASRASQEDAGSGAQAEQGSNEDAATPEGEPHAEAIEPRVMGQVTAMVLPLERLDEDTTFRLRDEGDVSELATDLARLGQLFPVDVRPRGEDRYQLICGFRRVAALRFLKRDQLQVRVHEELSDEDALLLSLAEAIHASPVEHDVLEAKRESLEAEGRLTAPVRDMLEKALATEETLAPEGVEEEIDADELAVDVAQRMGALNQDLSLLADVFAALDESRKAELLMQLRYSAQLVAYLEDL
ncbi:ParB/RepB/Spo0J family partition protein [Corallococcus aberystwythensis]|uniref:Chromosome partitioning protein ParB n=1 Tax=Corallococcus aberystwythensis TaxID=2316722 RepID=A0A3A8PDU7_9BACT|nr:ParB N-terminal domain-containing protein [Corallococcus aberystwythensis]RKH54577.1 chromosome partitioning protein ParB [Corallococcus aberystwythensis]